MPVTVKNISLWRKEVENQVGSLAHTLAPVTKAGANLHVLMGYRYPGDGTKAAIELYPVAGKKVTAAASEAGLSASSIPTLLVEGDDRAGLGLASPRPSPGRGSISHSLSLSPSAKSSQRCLASRPQRAPRSRRRSS